MDKKIHLSLIIPAYNEAKRLPITLIDADRHLNNVDFSYEIIVVDNGSTDGTREVAEKFSKLIKNLRVISIDESGKGLAIKAGMLNAQGQYRAFIDADNSVSVDQIIDALPYFKNGYEVVVGSRNMKGGKHDQKWYRMVAGIFGNLMIQAFLLPGFWDTQCPLKILRADVAESVFKISKVRHFGFDVEILSLAEKMGYRIKQVPAVFKNEPSSKVRTGSYPDVLWDILKVRFWLWTNNYNFYIDAPPKRS
jgi:dolichyl-phosphate beta-glucosyltransferase